MAGGYLDIVIDGNTSEAARLLAQIERRGSHLRPVLNDFGEHLLQSHDDRFDDQESPEGVPWAELTPKYKARKKRNKDLILVLNDILSGTLHYQTTARSLLFGTDLIYGATHQFGDDDRGIEARPYLGVSDEDETEFISLAEKHLMASF